MQDIFENIKTLLQEDRDVSELETSLENAIHSPTFDSQYTDSDGNSLLHLICKKIDIDDYCKYFDEYSAIIEKLLVFIDVNLKNKNGDTCMHFFSKKRLTLFFRILIKNGALANITNKNGESPLIYMHDHRYLKFYENRTKKIDNLVNNDGLIPGKWNIVKCHINFPTYSRSECNNTLGYFNISELEISYGSYYLMIEFLSHDNISYFLKTRTGIYSNEDGESYTVTSLKDIFDKYSLPNVTDFDISTTDFSSYETDDDGNYTSKQNIEMIVAGEYGLICKGNKYLYSEYDNANDNADEESEIKKNVHEVIINNLLEYIR